MASIDQMRQAAASQGATAPAGYPGGADAWVKDWYQNAVNAGSVVDPTTPYTRGEATATDQTTGATPQGRKNTGSSAFADMIRAKAKAEHWSEDFERFSDAQIEAWKPFYDEKTGKFHSENDPTGAATYDKPAECPPGTTFHGSKCVGWDQLPPELGGTLGMPKGTQPSGAASQGTASNDYYNPDDPLQAKLMELMQSGGGAFGGINAGAFTQGGGAMWSTPTPGGATAANPAQPSPTATSAAAIPPVTPTGPGNAALMSATLNAFTPNAPSGGGGGVSSAVVPQATDSGVATQPPTANAPATPTQYPSAPPPRQPVGKMLTDPNDWWKSPRTA